MAFFLLLFLPFFIILNSGVIIARKCYWIMRFFFFFMTHVSNKITKYPITFGNYQLEIKTVKQILYPSSSIHIYFFYFDVFFFFLWIKVTTVHPLLLSLYQYDQLGATHISFDFRSLSNVFTNMFKHT